MKRSLSRLFRPKSIAVVGGGSWCANVIEQCQKIGFSGPVWPVHPHRQDILGVSTFANVNALPTAPDAAFIGVNRDATIDVVSALAGRGSGGAVCFASGFSEAQSELSDGTALQDALLAAAGNMPIIGPNCYGFVNYLDRAALWPDQHGGVPVERGVAIITQSSNIAINLSMQRRGLPIAYLMTAGNQAQTGMAEIATELLSDARVTALGLHIEGIDDLRAFETLATRAREVGKPIVGLKVGASEQARAATISHTASLAGSDAGARALFARLGIGQVHSLAGMLESLKLLHVAGPLTSNRIASMSCSGGEASLMADAAVATDLVYPALSESQKKGLRVALGPKVALANPLDYHTYIWDNVPAMTATFSALMQGDLAIGCIVVDFPREDRCNAEAWECVISAAEATQAATGKQMALLGSLSDTLPEPVAIRVLQRGLLPLCGMSEAIEAMDVAAQIGAASETFAPLLLPLQGYAPTKTLTEAQAKSALADHGLRVPRSGQANSAKEAGQIADALDGPVVVKGQGVAHKTEAGAVVLNVYGAKEVEKAADAMPMDTFLVEEMVQDSIAELLVGVVKDPAHGYVLTLAAGGTLTELLQDSTSLLVPSDAQAIRATLSSLKVAKLLEGYRGAPSADMDAIIQAVMAVQKYVAAEHPEEVEINPLMCRPHGAVAADALIKIGAPK